MENLCANALRKGSQEVPRREWDKQDRGEKAKRGHDCKWSSDFSPNLQPSLVCKLQFRMHPSWRPGSYQLPWKEGLGRVANFWDFPMLALVAASPMAQGQSSEEGTAAGHLQQSTQTGGWSTDKKCWLQSWLVNFRAWTESLVWSVGLKESAMGQDTESQCGSMQDIRLSIPAGSQPPSPRLVHSIGQGLCGGHRRGPVPHAIAYL